MLTNKILSALSAFIVMLLLLPYAVLAQETPITAADIAGYWVGDFYREDDYLPGTFSMKLYKDGTGIFDGFFSDSFPVSYANGIISGTGVTKYEYATINISLNASVSRDAGEFIIEGKLTSESSLGDEGDPPVVWFFKATRIGVPVSPKELPEDEPSREDDIPVLINPTLAPGETPAPTPSPTKRIPKPTLEDTIVRFGDLWGEVNVRPNDEDDDAYIFAELSTPLHHNDRIRTLTRSGAILSFSDMSTFVMKEDTTIVLDIATEHKSKIKMLAGNFWINFKKIWTDGSMEIEMSQAVCGIKATTLIIEETDYVSTLKVLEGEVEFTSKATGEVEYVGGGQMISADAYGLGEIEPFDIEEEMKGWHETARQITANEINKKSRRGVFITIGLVLALGIIASVIIAVLRHERSRKLSPVPTIAPYYVPRHCSRCGNSVPPASKYCPFCSAPLVAPYTAPRHCSRCGKTLPPSGKFCPICGEPVPVPPSDSYR